MPGTSNQLPRPQNELCSSRTTRPAPARAEPHLPGAAGEPQRFTGSSFTAPSCPGAREAAGLRGDLLPEPPSPLSTTPRDRLAGPGCGTGNEPRYRQLLLGRSSGWQKIVWNISEGSLEFATLATGTGTEGAIAPHVPHCLGSGAAMHPE